MNWTPAKKAVAAYLKATRTGTGYALVCGLELLRLKAGHPEKRGGDQKSGDQRSRRNQNPQRAGFDSWEETVEKELGISDDTAQRWMRLARGFLAGEWSLRNLGEKAWWDLPPAQQKALLKAAQAWANGKTIRELQHELQQLLDDAPAGDVGGGAGGSLPVPQLDPATELRARQEAARLKAEEFTQALWVADLSSAWGGAPLFALRGKDDVRLEVAALDRAAELRKIWLLKGEAAMLARRQEMIEEARKVDSELARMAQAEAEAERARKALARKAERENRKNAAAK